ncbi:MAG: xanthine dehydrogenase family protein molybdopterin-binding subunit [Rhodospirillaceae bacterium]
MSEHPSTSEGYVGQSVRTLEGRAPVMGQATYTNDLNFPGQLHAHVLRSPHAAANIKSVDKSGAEKVAGVVCVMDGEDAAEVIDPIPHYIDPAVFGGRSATIRCLAKDHVWCFGQPVAVVVAEDKRTARFAASRITVDYEITTPVIDPEEAIKDDAPMVVPDWDANMIMQVPFANGDVGQAFSAADRIVKTEVKVHRFSTQPIETRTYNAVYEPGTQDITLYGTVQNPHPLRNVLSKILRMPENKIRVHAPVIGGAFGMKMHGHPEEGMVCMLSKVTGRPVKWVEDREECLLIGAREQVHRVELAVKDDGTILGLRDHYLANTGAPSSCPGWGMAFLTGLTMPGPYAVQDIDVMLNAVVTNKPGWNASRGYGKEVTALALELSVENVARELNMDPVDIRMKNFIKKDQFPYDSPTGLIYDSGDYAGVMQAAMDTIHYDGWKSKQEEARKEGRYIGIGVGFELTPEGGTLPATMVAGYDSSTVRVSPDGSVRVLTGVTTPGSGNPTGIAQIVADELGVRLDTIEVVQGDTTTCPYGFGNSSGRSTIVGGGSAAKAAQEVRGKIIKVAAALMEVDEDSVTMRDSIIASGDKTIGLEDVCYACYTRAYDVASIIEPPLEATATFKPGLVRHTPNEKGQINPYPSYSNAAYVVISEVDVDTGEITLIKAAVAHDCGKVINPILVEGQACGAILFGIGGVMSENITFDENGRQLTKNFMDYVMPRIGDMPPIELAHHDSPNPVTYMGLKGAGEAGVGGSAAAIVNSVNNALSPFGVMMTELPLSAPRVWSAIQDAKKAQPQRKVA